MTLEKKTAHVAEALANLVTQFKDKPKLAAFITALINQVSDLENVFFQLIDDRTLDTAVGVQLDGFGLIVGENREGRSDDEYRIAIRARIILNLGHGTPEDLIALLSAVSDGKNVHLEEYFPAALTTLVTGVTISEAILLNDALQSGKPAGVKAHLIYGEVDEDDLLQFDIGPGWDQGRWAGILGSDTIFVSLKSRNTGEFLISRDGDKELIAR